MGRVHSEVINNHGLAFRNELALFAPFLNGFDITWIARRRAYGADFVVLILKPEPSMSETFGFDSEIALFFFNYPTTEARTFQAINGTMFDEPLRGRVDPGFYFLCSRDPKLPISVNDYLFKNPQTRQPVPITVEDLDIAKTDPWHLRNCIARTSFVRDLFDFRLPLDNDLFFFGRDALVSDMIDSVKKSQNRGLFGLRKTGKTSILFKIKRQCEDGAVAKVVYIDCKSTLIRSMSAEDLVEYVANKVYEQVGLTASRKNAKTPYHDLETVINLASKKGRICLIFDEIEYISFDSKTNDHWRKDFIDFWQFLWSMQSQLRSFSFIICGVNPHVLEEPVIDGIQNPLFGIITPVYITGLESDAIFRMIKYFGRRMGLTFDAEFISDVTLDYGGHPLLTRLACSYIHRIKSQADATRPLQIGRAFRNSIKEICDGELVGYCKHIVSELEMHYPLEYEMLELISIGMKGDFIELMGDQETIGHLVSYGIISNRMDKGPSVKLPILRRYIAYNKSKKEGRRSPVYAVNPMIREDWLKRRMGMIVEDFRHLLKRCAALGKPKIYPVQAVPDADKLTGVSPVQSREEFVNFAILLNSVFCENIDRYQSKGFFFGSFKTEYPALFDALYRIRIYRNWVAHSELNTPVQDACDQYFERDMLGRRPGSLDDGWFMLQQVIIDELFVAVQIEAASVIE